MVMCRELVGDVSNEELLAVLLVHHFRDFPELSKGCDESPLFCSQLVKTPVVKPEERMVRVVGVHYNFNQGVILAVEHQIKSKLEVVHE